MKQTAADLITDLLTAYRNGEVILEDSTIRNLMEARNALLSFND